tara:strand:+ start:161 stop:304 length:144 start_codon:yes stop_codon:yes gene_type:complete
MGRSNLENIGPDTIDFNGQQEIAGCGEIWVVASADFTFCGSYERLEG